MKLQVEVGKHEKYQVTPEERMGRKGEKPGWFVLTSSVLLMILRSLPVAKRSSSRLAPVISISAST
jgi:hypothetical protein